MRTIHAWAIFGFVAVLGLGLPGRGHAALPQTLNYQGRVTGAGGNLTPVADSLTNTVIFSIYTVASSGSNIWTETQSNVATKNGFFNVILGSVNPLSIPFDQQYYLGVNFNGDGEMSPRQVLTMAPYAFNAQNLALPYSAATSLGSQVFNISNSGSGIAVHGQGTGAASVQGDNSSASGVGVLGSNSAAGIGVSGSGLTGVAGIANTGGGIGVVANQSSGALALRVIGGAKFEGPGSVSFTSAVDFSGATVTGLNSSVSAPLTLTSASSNATLSVTQTGSGNAIQARSYASSSVAVSASAALADAIYGVATGNGAYAGVHGNAGPAANWGVYGELNSNAQFAAVYGKGFLAIAPSTPASVGVVGVSNQTSGVGVWGEDDAGSGGSAGMVGKGVLMGVSATATSGNGTGVQGIVSGVSGNGTGVIGQQVASANTGNGVWAINGGALNTGYALRATNSSFNGTAAYIENTGGLGGTALDVSGNARFEGGGHTATFYSYVSFVGGTNLVSGVPVPLTLGGTAVTPILSVSQSGLGGAITAVDYGAGTAVSAVSTVLNGVGLYAEEQAGGTGAGIVAKGLLLGLSSTATANNGVGILGASTAILGTGVVGTSASNSGAGVDGYGFIGTRGVSNQGTNGTGTVGGISTASNSGFGVQGQNTGSPNSGSGVKGSNLGISNTGTGVWGFNNSGTGIGVLADSNGTVGTALYVSGNAVFGGPSGRSVVFNQYVTFNAGTNLAYPVPLTLTGSSAWPSGVITATNTGNGFGIVGAATFPGTDIGGAPNLSTPVTAGLYGYTNSTDSAGVLGKGFAAGSTAGVVGMGATGVMGNGIGSSAVGGQFFADAAGNTAVAATSMSGTGGTFQGVTGAVISAQGTNPVLGLMVQGNSPAKALIVQGDAIFGNPGNTVTFTSNVVFSGSVTGANFAVPNPLLLTNTASGPIISALNTGIGAGISAEGSQYAILAQGDNSGPAVSALSNSGPGITVQSANYRGIESSGRFIGVSATATDASTGIGGVFQGRTGLFVKGSGPWSLSATTSSNPGTAIYGEGLVINSNGVKGFSSGANGYGIWGTTNNSSATGVFAEQQGGSGNALLVSGNSQFNGDAVFNNFSSNSVTFNSAVFFVGPVAGLNIAAPLSLTGSASPALYAFAGAGNAAVVVSGSVASSGVLVSRNFSSASQAGGIFGVASNALALTRTGVMGSSETFFTNPAGPIGVYGYSASGNGQMGLVDSGSNTGAGVYGLNAGTSSTGAGVRAESLSGSGYGLMARNSSNSGAAIAISASSASTQGIGGYFQAVTGLVVVGSAEGLSVSGGAYFNGPVTFTGTVSGLSIAAPLSLSSSSTVSALAAFNSGGGTAVLGQTSLAGGNGVYGKATVAGARAIVADGFDMGLSATASSSSGSAVLAQAGTSGTGVSATGGSVGVYGASASGTGVVARSNGGTGLQANNNSLSDAITGVNASDGSGVSGYNNGNFFYAPAVYGHSNLGQGGKFDGVIGVGGTGYMGGSFVGTSIGASISGTAMGLSVTGGAEFFGAQSVSFVGHVNFGGPVTGLTVGAPLSLSSPSAVTALSAYNSNIGNAILGQANLAGGTGVYAKATVAGAKALVADGFDVGLSATASSNGGTAIWALQTGGAGQGVSATGSNNGVLGYGAASGVQGYSAAGTGVQGSSASGYGVTGSVPLGGVAGVSGSTVGNGHGVEGSSGGGIGVYGTSTSGDGIQGNVGSAAVGVHGVNTGSGYGVQGHSNGGTGVYGDNSGGGTGYGVQGNSFTITAGVLGTSSAGPGVQGTGSSNAGGSFSGLTGVVATGTGLGLSVTGGAQFFGSRSVSFTGHVNFSGPVTGLTTASPLNVTGSTLASTIFASNVSSGAAVYATSLSGTAIVAAGAGLGISVTALSGPAMYVGASTTGGTARFYNANGTALGLDATSVQPVLTVTNDLGGSAIDGEMDVNTPQAYGVLGNDTGGGGAQVYGVWGNVTNGNTGSIGVLGTVAGAVVPTAFPSNVGILGVDANLSGLGVEGLATGNGGVGVYGQGKAIGVSGVASVIGGGIGVRGQVGSGANVGVMGIYNTADATLPALGVGIFGSNDSAGAAIYGRNETSGPAMIAAGATFGISATASGVNGVGGYFSGVTGVVAAGSAIGLSVTGGTAEAINARTSNASGSAVKVQNDGSGGFGIQGIATGSGVGVKAALASAASGGIAVNGQAGAVAGVTGVQGDATGAGSVGVSAVNTAATVASGGSALVVNGLMRMLQTTLTTAAPATSMTITASTGGFVQPFNAGGSIQYLNFSNTLVTANTVALVSFNTATPPVPFAVKAAVGALKVYLNAPLSISNGDSVNVVIINP